MLVNDRTDRLSRTLSELQLSTPTHMPTTETALAPSSASHPQQIARPHLNSKDPTFSIFGGFAKVTQAARDLSSNPFSGPFNSRLLLNLFGCFLSPIQPLSLINRSNHPKNRFSKTCQTSGNVSWPTMRTFARVVANQKMCLINPRKQPPQLGSLKS